MIPEHFLKGGRKRTGEICWLCFETRRSHKDAPSSRNRGHALPPKERKRKREGEERERERERERE